MTLVLALDVGSSSVRARAYDEDGNEVPRVGAQESYEVRHGPGGRAEFDPEQLAREVTAALERARRECDAPIDAVGASCFWHSLLAVDERGRALTPVLTWRDNRSVDDADALRRRLDPDAVHARTGCHLHPSYWPAKLAWLRRADPDAFRAAHRFVSFSDYLYGRLVGSLRTSLSMASATGLLDQNARAWDGELLDELGLDPARLPELSDEPTHAADGVPWYPALGDGACSNVGAGCTAPGRGALMVGTSAALRVAFAADRAEPRPGLFLYRVDDGRFVEGGALSDGGNLHAWVERTLRLPESPQLREPDAHGLTFLPLLGGERSPAGTAARTARSPASRSRRPRPTSSRPRSRASPTASASSPTGSAGSTRWSPPAAPCARTPPGCRSSPTCSSGRCCSPTSPRRRRAGRRL